MIHTLLIVAPLYKILISLISHRHLESHVGQDVLKFLTVLCNPYIHSRWSLRSVMFFRVNSYLHYWKPVEVTFFDNNLATRIILCRGVRGDDLHASSKTSRFTLNHSGCWGLAHNYDLLVGKHDNSRQLRKPNPNMDESLWSIKNSYLLVNKT